MIRTSKHSIKFANRTKLLKYREFLLEYAEAVQFYIDYLWQLETTRTITTTKKNKETEEITTKTSTYEWYPSRNQYQIPKRLSTTDIPYETNLSARALKCAVTQAIGIIQSSVKKYNNKQYVLSMKQGTSADTSKLQSWIDKNTPTKPMLKSNFDAELNSINATFVETPDKSFDGFIQLSSLGTKYGKIIIPIKFTKRSNYWKDQGKMLKSFMFSNDNISFRWDIAVVKNESSVVIGADLGQSTAVTFSDGVITPKNIQGHDLKSICEKMSRKKKGSKAFKRCQDERTNYINWSVKQLNLNNYSCIRLESNKNIKKGKRTSKSLTHWSWSDTYKAITALAEQYDVHIDLQAPTYKSQRCSCCGYVHKGNRSSKTFVCRKCGFAADADLNGATNNNVVDLPVISKSFIAKKLNHIGFYWTNNGFFLGEEPTVPLTNNGIRNDVISIDIKSNADA